MRAARARTGWPARGRISSIARRGAPATFAGEIGLFDVAADRRGACIGYACCRAWRGRGYATRAVRLLSALGAAGRRAGPRSSRARDPANTASQRVLERAGFTREGYQRGHLPAAGGGRADVVSYALLATDLTDGHADAEHPVVVARRRYTTLGRPDSLSLNR